MTNKQNEKFRAVHVSLWLGIVAAVAMHVVLRPHGLAVHTDSVVYLQAAKYAAAGEGFVNYSKTGILEPMTGFPPVWPLLTGTGYYLGMDAFTWAGIVNTFLFGLNIFLMAMLAFRLTGRRRTALGAGLLGLLSVHLFEVHAGMLSEPLFIVFMLSSFWALSRYLDGQLRKDLLLAGLFSSLAFMTRYGGISVIVTGVIMLGFLADKEARGRWKDVLIFLALALPLPLLWIGRNLSAAGELVGLPLGFFPANLNGSWHFIDVFSTYLMPTILPLTARWLILAIFVYFLVKTIKASGPASRLTSGWKVLIVFLAVYLVGTVLARFTASGGNMPFDHRLLIPAWIVVLILLSSCVRPATVPESSWRKSGAAGIVISLFLAIAFLRTVQFARDFHRHGIGYGSARWTQTGLVKNVKTLSDEVPVYANDPFGFYFYAGRPAVYIPSANEKSVKWPAVEEMKNQFIAQRAVAIVFNEARFQPHQAWLDLVKQVPLSVLYKDDFGSIWGYRPPPAEQQAAVNP